MSTRDVLEVLLGAPSRDEGTMSSGTRRRYEIEPERLGSTTDDASTDDADRPAWTDDDDAWGDRSG